MGGEKMMEHYPDDGCESGVIVEPNTDPEMDNYNWGLIIRKSSALGRPLTDEEFQSYRLSDAEIANRKIEIRASQNSFAGTTQRAAR